MSLLQTILGSEKTAIPFGLLRFMIVVCPRCDRLFLLRPVARTCLQCREGEG